MVMVAMKGVDDQAHDEGKDTQAAYHFFLHSVSVKNHWCIFVAEKHHLRQ